VINPLDALWVPAAAIQSIKSLISITLDVKGSNFTKWRNFCTIAVTKYALANHLVTEVPPADGERSRLDCTILHWMHGSIAADILDMIMEEKTNAVWTCITAPFGEKQETHNGTTVVNRFCFLKHAILGFNFKNHLATKLKVKMNIIRIYLREIKVFKFKN
jgi:hypothetical protein